MTKPSLSRLLKHSLILLLALMLMSCEEPIRPTEQLQQSLQGYWIGDSPEECGMGGIYAEFVGNKFVVNRLIKGERYVKQSEAGLEPWDWEQFIFDFEPIDGNRIQIIPVTKQGNPALIEVTPEVNQFSIENLVLTNQNFGLADLVNQGFNFNDSLKPKSNISVQFTKAQIFNETDLKGTWRSSARDYPSWVEVQELLEFSADGLTSKRLTKDNELDAHQIDEMEMKLDKGFMISGEAPVHFLWYMYGDDHQSYPPIPSKRFIYGLTEDKLTLIDNDHLFDGLGQDCLHPQANAFIEYEKVTDASFQTLSNSLLVTDILEYEIIKIEEEKIKQEEEKKKAEEERKRRIKAEKARKAAAEKAAEKKRQEEARQKRLAEEKAEKAALKDIYQGIGKEFCGAIVERNNVVSKELRDPLTVKTASKYQTVIEEICASSSCYKNIMEARKIQALEGAEVALQSLNVIRETSQICSSSFDVFLLNNVERGWQRSLAPDFKESTFERAKMESFSRKGEYVPIYVPQPQYPRRAQSRGKEGYAVIEVIITTTGGVRDLKLIEEYPEGWGFGRAAMKAALKLKYNPRVVDGVGQEVPGVLYKFTFNMAR